MIKLLIFFQITIQTSGSDFPALLDIGPNTFKNLCKNLLTIYIKILFHLIVFYSFAIILWVHTGDHDIP